MRESGTQACGKSVLKQWQEVPDLLGAVKRTVDEDPTPGRFILTGPVRAELENAVWPGTGRILQVPMHGLSVREHLGHASLQPFIDRVLASGPSAVTAPDTALSVRDYLDLMLAGSFPEPSLRIPAAARRRWFAGYVEQMITRDAKTAQAYQALFQRMFVLDLVPAWFSNRIKRLVKAPKRYLVDPALVAAQLGAELAASTHDPRMYHLREEQGRRGGRPARRNREQTADWHRDQGRRYRHPQMTHAT